MVSTFSKITCRLVFFMLAFMLALISVHQKSGFFAQAQEITSITCDESWEPKEKHRVKAGDYWIKVEKLGASCDLHAYGKFLLNSHSKPILSCHGLIVDVDNDTVTCRAAVSSESSSLASLLSKHLSSLKKKFNLCRAMAKRKPPIYSMTFEAGDDLVVIEIGNQGCNVNVNRQRTPCAWVRMPNSEDGLQLMCDDRAILTFDDQAGSPDIGIFLQPFEGNIETVRVASDSEVTCSRCKRELATGEKLSHIGQEGKSVHIGDEVRIMDKAPNAPSVNYCGICSEDGSVDPKDLNGYHWHSVNGHWTLHRSN